MSVWDGIEELVTVVEIGSFSGAAKRLGVSTSYVSRQVAKLESRLGVQLLSRSTRTVRLTDAGAEYYRRCAELTAGVEAANQYITKETLELSGRIRVSMAGIFAERYVVPALTDFAKLHPKIHFELSFNPRCINLIEEGFDFAIRYGLLDDESGLVAHKFVDRKLMLCASEEYLRNMGRPVDPDELRDHACLRGNSDRWRFQYPDGPRYIRVSGPLKSNNVSTLITAAVQGLGIIYVTRASIFYELMSLTHLVPLLEDYCDVEPATWIVHADAQHIPLRVSHTIQFLLQRFSHWDGSEANLISFLPHPEKFS